MNHVPYRGTAPAMQDLQAGQIDAICDIIVTAVPQIEAKAVKAIANLSRERSSMLPDLPTAAERGLAKAQAYTWVAVYLPKGDARRDRPAPARGHAWRRSTRRPFAKSCPSSGRASSARTVARPSISPPFTRSEIEKWKGPVEASGAIE